MLSIVWKQFERMLKNARSVIFIINGLYNIGLFVTHNEKAEVHLSLQIILYVTLLGIDLFPRSLKAFSRGCSKLTFCFDVIGPLLRQSILLLHWVQQQIPSNLLCMYVIYNRPTYILDRIMHGNGHARVITGLTLTHHAFPLVFRPARKVTSNNSFHYYNFRVKG